MKNWVQPLGIAVFLALLVAGCGDFRAPSELAELQNREQVQNKLSELLPLTGEYRGELMDERSDRKVGLRLVLGIGGAPYANNGTATETTIPFLTGTAFLYSSQSISGVPVSLSFERSDYDSVSGQLILYGTESETTAFATVTGHAISGVFKTARVGQIGGFNVEKTDAPGL
jgi:hypothetical protein